MNDQLRYFRNNEDGTFTDHTKRIGFKRKETASRREDGTNILTSQDLWMKAADRKRHGRGWSFDILPDDFIEGEHRSTIKVGEIHFERPLTTPSRGIVSGLNVYGRWT